MSARRLPPGSASRDSPRAPAGSPSPNPFLPLSPQVVAEYLSLIRSLQTSAITVNGFPLPPLYPIPHTPYPVPYSHREGGDWPVVVVPVQPGPGAYGSIAVNSGGAGGAGRVVHIPRTTVLGNTRKGAKAGPPTVLLLPTPRPLLQASAPGLPPASPLTSTTLPPSLLVPLSPCGVPLVPCVVPLVPCVVLPRLHLCWYHS